MCHADSATKAPWRCLHEGMRHRERLRTWLWSSLVFCLGATALIADTPRHAYVGIAVGNVFRLRPPPRQEAGTPPAPLPGVTPVGITTILGDKRVLLKLRFPARPPEPAKEASCILTVGQREGPIEVLEIDETAGSVKVNNSGTVVVLTLAKDGPRQSTGPLAPIPEPLRQ
jgi:hypothetical protein